MACEWLYMYEGMSWQHKFTALQPYKGKTVVKGILLNEQKVECILFSLYRKSACDTVLPWLMDNWGSTDEILVVVTFVPLKLKSFS